jgi:hypothetical protein
MLLTIDNVGGLQKVDGCTTADAALDQVAVLLERAEAAERKAAAWESAARHAERRLAEAERLVKRVTARRDYQ